MASGWNRDFRHATATRQDDLSIVSVDEAFAWEAHTANGTVERLTYSGLFLDDAITEADARWPPEGWQFVSGLWITLGWIVREADPETGWIVQCAAPSSAGGMRLATKTVFKTADRARTWAEIRRDRTGSNLRGPKPRAGAASSATLPDVRVTETERYAALQLAADLGLSFADLMRVSLTIARDTLVTRKSYVLVRVIGESQLRAVLSEGVRTDAAGASYLILDEETSVPVHLICMAAPT